MRKPSTLIFDFDGTLADTFGIAVIEFRKFFKDGSRATDDAEIERLRGMTAREAFKSVGVRWWQLPRLAFLAREAVRERIGAVKSFDGMDKTLKRLHDDGLHMLIVSSNSTKNIEVFLHNNNMQGYFDHFYGGMGVFDKSGALKRIIRKNGLTADECVYIGDEARDIEAARRAGVRSVGVTWGFNNRHALQAADPAILIDRPADLLGLFAAAKP
jgi:phosphoglycolate phosphatase